MNARHLLIVAVAAAIALTAALWSSALRETDITDSDLLIPGLADRINDISSLKVSTAGDELAVSIRSDKENSTGWTVEQKHNYPVNTGQLRSALLKLARAKVLEQKTSNPELYSRLGVEDVSAADAGGKRIDIGGLAEPLSLIIGNSAASTSDTYVRYADMPASLMIRGSLEIPTDPVEWLDRGITDIPASQIQSATLEFADGSHYAVDKVSRDESNYAVDGIPDGRELTSPTSPNLISSGLSDLRFEDVAPAADIDFTSHEPTVTTYKTFDGLFVEITSAEIDDRIFAQLVASHDAALALQSANGDDGNSDDTADMSMSAEERAAAINKIASGWAYEISRTKYNQMTRRLEDLLKPLPDNVDDEN